MPKWLAGIVWGIAGVLDIVGVLNLALLVVPDLLLLTNAGALVGALAAVLLAASPRSLASRIALLVWGVASALYTISYAVSIDIGGVGLGFIAAPLVVIGGLAAALTTFLPRRARGPELWVVPVLGLLSVLSVVGGQLGIGETGLLLVALLTGPVSLVGGILIAVRRGRPALLGA